MNHFHVVVWIDHQHGRLFSLGRDSGERELTLIHHSPEHLHHKAGPVAGPGNGPNSTPLFKELATALGDAGEILLIGPGLAKKEFASYLQKEHSAVFDKVVGVETVDHPTDGEIVKAARRLFHALDRLAGN